MRTEYWPVAIGVPPIAPFFGSMLRPGGKSTAPHTYGAVPPAAFIVTGPYAAPTAPGRSERLVMATLAAIAIVMAYTCEVLTEAVESVTVIAV